MKNSKDYELFEKEIAKIKALMRSHICMEYDTNFLILEQKHPDLLSDNFKNVRAVFHKAFKEESSQYLLIEVTLVKIVSAFEWFLTTSLEQFYFGHKDLFSPHIGVFVRMADLKGANTDGQIRGVLIRNYIRQIALKGVETTMDYARKIDKKKKSIRFEQKDLENFKKVRLVRNLFLHAGGIVSEEFKKEYGKAKLKVGDKLMLSSDEFFDFIEAIENLAIKINLASPGVVRAFYSAALEKLGGVDSAATLSEDSPFFSK